MPREVNEDHTAMDLRSTALRVFADNLKDQGMRVQTDIQRIPRNETRFNRTVYEMRRYVRVYHDHGSTRRQVLAATLQTATDLVMIGCTIHVTPRSEDILVSVSGTVTYALLETCDLRRTR